MRAPRAVSVVVVVLALAVLAGGCAVVDSRGVSTDVEPPPPQPQIQSALMTLADELMFSAADACAQVRRRTDRPEAQAWCATIRLGTAIGAVSAATAQNAEVGFIDLLTLATLQRMAMEEPAARDALDEADRNLLHGTFARAEETLWTRVGRYASPQEVEELRSMIVAWREVHPDRASVSQVRLLEFARDRQTMSGDVIGGGKPAGTILRLLRIDPLQGLDPATRQLAQTRLLGERLAYWGQRMPLIAGWQIELTVDRLTGSHAARQALDHSGQVAAAATGLTDSAARLATSFERTLEDLPNERAAAIQQASDEVATAVMSTVDRLSREVDAHRTRALEDAARLVAAERRQTLLDAEAAADRLVDRAALRLFLVTTGGAVAVACVTFGYRRLTGRRAAPATSGHAVHTSRVSPT